MKRCASPFAVAAVLAGVLALVALLIYGLSQNEPDRGIDARSTAASQARPDFTADRLDGKGEGSLADYRGKVVVLNFWASWCEPCRDESPLLDRWHEKVSRRRRVAPCSAWTCST